MPGRYIIARKDLNLDQVIIESEGLTIGRLTGNDLSLNHPTVSRTQAGITEINSGFWIFNLSNANGTLLNGGLIADKVPILDGDVIQIGPFILTARLRDNDLVIEVEATVNVLPIDAPAAVSSDSPADGNTVILNLSAFSQPQPKKSVTQLTMRLSDLTGLLSGKIPGIDEQALKIFWEKRKREAGKLTSDTPLQPKGRIRLGKAQFNWRPTLDLQRAWPKSLFAWGAVMMGVLSLLGAFFYLEAYSPAPVSESHSRRNLLLEPAVALKPNGNSCTTCHTLTGSMQKNCSECHTTAAFSPKVSDAHEKVKLDCLACHTEHQGAGFRPALVASSACVNCHRDGSDFISPETGKPLKTPHGGTLGYPVANGEWNWAGMSERDWARKGLIGKAGDFAVKDQFHLVHLAGREQGRSNCSDCHTSGFEGMNLRAGVKESCAGCHSTPASGSQTANSGTSWRGALTATSLTTGRAMAGAPSCVSCHSQHGNERNSSATVRQLTSN
ncbi:MAG: FHA domain-containing protein [Acidobacteriota bacterium]